MGAEEGETKERDLQVSSMLADEGPQAGARNHTSGSGRLKQVEVRTKPESAQKKGLEIWASPTGLDSRDRCQPS